MAQREITDLQPTGNPDISRVTFADGLSYPVPTGPIQQAYQEQQRAKQASMLASNMPISGGNGMQQAADFLRPQPGAPAATSPVGSHANPPPVSQPYQPPTPSPVQSIPEQQIGGSREVGLLNAAGVKWSPQDEAMAQASGLNRMQVAAARTPQAVTPKITQQQWQQRAGQGTVLPTAQSTTVSGRAPGVSDAEVQSIANKQLQAADETAKALSFEAQAKQESARATAATAQQIADQKQAEIVKKDAEWKQAWGQFNEKFASDSENKVDPNRWFQHSGALGGALAIIGGGLTEAANILSGRSGPNALDKIIDRDIRAQEADIQSRRGAANNQLMILSQQFGSLEAGKVALGVAQRQAIETKLDTLLQNNPNMLAADKSRINAAKLDLQAKAEKQAADLKAIYGGTVNQTTQGQVVYPQAQKVTGGGYNLGKINAEVRGNQEYDLKAAEAGQKTVAPEVAQHQAGMEASKEGMQQIAAAQGFNYDSKTGQWTKPDGWVSQLPHNGIYRIRHPSNITTDTPLATENQHKASAAYDNTATLIAKNIYGERVTPEGINHVKETLHGAHAGEELERFNQMWKTIETQQKVYGGSITNQQRANEAGNIRRESNIQGMQPVGETEEIRR